MIVRGHACAIGDIFDVERIEGGGAWHIALTCTTCGWRFIADEACACVGDEAVPVRWCRKLPPLAELERVDEEAHA